MERLLATHMLSGATITVDTAVDQPDDTVSVEEEARGSKDTLKEAGGNRADNALERRRVDVIVESSQRISGEAEESRPLLTRSTASRFWHVSVDVSAGASIGAAGQMLAITLSNDSSGQSMQGKIWAGGGGPKASIGASKSVWSDPTGFYTDEPLFFQDFNGVWVRYTSAGIQLFLGYSQSYITFAGLGDGAESINVSGWSAGTVGLGGAVVTGPLSLEGSYPPTQLPIKGSDVTTIPYEQTERGEDKHSVLFATGDAELTDVESAILDSFLASVVSMRR